MRTVRFSVYMTMKNQNQQVRNRGRHHWRTYDIQHLVKFNKRLIKEEKRNNVCMRVPSDYL